MKSNETKTTENLSRAVANQVFGENCTSLFYPGNRFSIQPKLTINQPDDIYEQEADRVANEVMTMQSPAIQTKPLQISSIQRMCSHCEEEQKNMQRKESGNGEITADNELESYVGNLNGGGRALPEDVRSFFEPRFGYDLSNVKVHTDSVAAKSAQSINALAYTNGNNIVFNEGQYSPNTDSGKRLLGHELTHVLQQGSAGVQRVSADSETVDEFEPEFYQLPVGTVIQKKSQFDAADKSETFIQRRIGDGHDLTNPRFSGDIILEACFDNEQVLTIGSRGESVRKVQQALIDIGFALPNFGADGVFGSETQTAVRDFQRSSGLTVDGVVGPQTMGALDTSLSGPTPPAPVPPGPVPPVPPPPTPAATITSETVALSPAPRTRILIGVGEEVTLTHSAGTATTTWTTSAGQLRGTAGAAPVGPSVILSAPDIAVPVIVTAAGAMIIFFVIAPTDVHMDRFSGTGVRHEQNRPRVGMMTQPFLLPDTVNFNKVTYEERDVLAVANGTYSCFNGAVGHCGHGGSGGCGDLFMTDTVVAGKGTQSVLADCVDSGDCGQAAPFTPGTISFAIPYEYKVGTGPFHPILTVNQVMTLAANATDLTADKAGAHAATIVANPQLINGGGCP